MVQVTFKFCLITVFLVSCYGDKFSFCKSGDDACLAKSIETAIYLLKAGVPEYGLASLDPLPVDKMTIDAGKGPVQLIQHYRNIDLLGFSDVSVKKAHYDDAKKTLQLTMFFPKIIQKGNYTIDGKILALPVVGDGLSTITLENAEFLVNIQFRDTQKNGQTYYKLKHFVMSIEPNRVRMNFENLFNGNKLLADNILQLVNEEWEALFKDVKPSTEKNYAEVFKKYAQVFFDHVPASQIFLK